MSGGGSGRNRTVEWAPAAAADLERLDRKMQERVRRALYRLADFGIGDVKKLRGHEAEWRLRVGPWRVRFTLEASAKTVQVLRVLPRSSAYRD